MATSTLSTSETIFPNNFSSSEPALVSANSTDREGTWIRYYVVHVITIGGVLSNILALTVVASSRRMRMSPSGVLLLSLSIIDTLVLVTERIETMTSSRLGRHRLGLKAPTLIAMYYIKYSGRCAASFVVTCISINRFAVVVYPLKSDWFMHCKNALIQVASSVVFALLINMYVVIYPPLIKRTYYGYFYGVVAVEVVLTDIIISLTILVMSAMTASTFLKSGQGVRRSSSKSRSDSIVSARRADRQVTVLLLTVALTYVVLRIQYRLTWIPVFFMHNVQKADPPDSLRMAYYITYCIYLLNYATNLYQYSLCSSVFRIEFRKLFCFWKKIVAGRKTSTSSMKSHGSVTCKTHATAI